MKDQFCSLADTLLFYSVSILPAFGLFLGGTTYHPSSRRLEECISWTLVRDRLEREFYWVAKKLQEISMLRVGGMTF